MIQDKIPPHFHLNMPDWGIIALMQDLLTGKVRVTPLLTEPQEAGA